MRTIQPRRLEAMRAGRLGTHVAFRQYAGRYRPRRWIADDHAEAFTRVQRGKTSRFQRNAPGRRGRRLRHRQRGGREKIHRRHPGGGQFEGQRVRRAERRRCRCRDHRIAGAALAWKRAQQIRSTMSSVSGDQQRFAHFEIPPRTPARQADRPPARRLAARQQIGKAPGLGVRVSSGYAAIRAASRRSPAGRYCASPAGIRLRAVASAAPTVVCRPSPLVGQGGVRLSLEW